MVLEPEHSHVNGVIKLIDALLNFKMDSKEFISNEKIVSKIGTAIDNLNKNISGYTLLSITKDKTRNLLFITKTNSSFDIYKWKINETIDKAVGVEIHAEEDTDNIPNYISENCSSHNIRRQEFISALIVPSLNGFSVNKSSTAQLMNLKNKDERHGPWSKDKVIEYRKENEDLISLARRINVNTDNIKGEFKKTIDELIKKNKIDMYIEHDFRSYNSDKLFVGEITNVKEIGGRRHFEIKWVSFKKFSDQYKYGRITKSCSPGVSSGASITIFKGVYSFNNREYGYIQSEAEYNPTNLENLPYNLADKGRLIFGIQESERSWKTIISADPKVDINFKESFEKEAIALIQQAIEEGHSIEGSSIKVPQLKAVMPYTPYEENQKKINPDLTGIRLKLKSLKVMIDEHNYLVKKNSSVGEDVTVTDSIKYNHDEGKIAYNDFSIAIQDEYVKSKLYNLFNSYLMKYYRSEATEQDILDSLIVDIFVAISERLNTGTRIDLELPIKINDKITVTVTGKVSKRYKKSDEEDILVDEKDSEVTSTSQLFYINDQRFNKNEVLMVIKEMTCYRSQEEADAFIRNIGRLGLSAYIGITTGYEVAFGEEQRIFRFKKLKGRSNYELLLDDNFIPIKGKKLITLLYENFIGQRVPDFHGKIPTLIYESSGSSMEYLKYKVLIDSTYKAFKDKSREYLNKKVEELGGSHVEYYNKKSRKLMEAVYVIGLSGKNYVIAYDSKNSYVFMDPEKDAEVNSEIDQYKEGKYICMIDQSNIKSNISYDTIVAKLLALKNDSSIAHTIYNLQEELD